MAFLSLKQLSAKQQLPVYTLEIFNTKTYVVNSLDMVVAAQRNTKTLSFNPFLLFSSKRMSQYDQAGMAVVNNNIEGAQGKWGYIPEMLDGVHHTLAPGPALDKMNHAVLNKLCPAINGVQGGDTFELQAWIRELFSVCSLESIYGPDWISTPELIQAFWWVKIQWIGCDNPYHPSNTSLVTVADTQQGLRTRYHHPLCGRFPYHPGTKSLQRPTTPLRRLYRIPAQRRPRARLRPC